MFINNSVKFWYEFYMRPTFELMKGYINSIENQIELNIQDFQKNKVDIELNNDSYTTEYQGLDDQSWNLYEIFQNHFPNLQRKSALITLTNMFEYELDQLCARYIKEYKYNTELSKIKGKGLDRSTKYLKDVCGIEIHKADHRWEKIKQIQNLRNIIVHQDGNITDNKNTIIYNNTFTTQQRVICWVRYCEPLSVTLPLII